MGKTFQDSGHLIRPALVVLIGLVAFAVVRHAVIPKDFGKYGHFRPGALDLVRSRPISYAGRDQCVLCHDAEGKMWSEGKHGHIGCETCHGPLAKHADDPASVVPKLPEVATLCVRCHEKDAAKPPKFPQVVSAEHSNGMACNDCHKPHNPHL